MFHRGSLNARGRFYSADYYLYGGSLGGPVYIPKVYDGKDKTFFWFSFGGFPLSITQQVNNTNAFSLGQRPMVVTGVDPGTSGSVSSRIDGYLNQAAFSPAAPNTFGNAPRTIGVRSPNIRNWDISVLKNMMIVEGFTAQFRLEAVNAFNTPVFRAPNTQYGNPNFGRITSQANFARIVQMSVRLMW